MDVAKHLLSDYRHIKDILYPAKPLSFLESYHYGEDNAVNLTEDGLPQKWSDVCDYIGGQHILNNSYRIYPLFVIVRAAMACVSGTTVFLECHNKCLETIKIESKRSRERQDKYRHVHQNTIVCEYWLLL